MIYHLLQTSKPWYRMNRNTAGIDDVDTIKLFPALMLTPYKLHNLVKQGDLPRVRDFLDASPPEELDINEYDKVGHTPLMHAAKSRKANVDLVRLLLHHCGDVHLEGLSPSVS